MKRITIQVGSYEVNCSLLCEGGNAWIVDPGAEGERIVRTLRSAALSPKAILLTHAHFDHIGAIPFLQREYPDLPVALHANDVPMLGHPFNANPPDYPQIGVPRNIVAIDPSAPAERSPLPPGVSAIETPGHTPGGLCYYIESIGTVLTGDTLFAGSAGRTDFPGGSMTQLMRSLATLCELPGATVAVPGHGPETTIAAEKADNPYLAT